MSQQVPMQAIGQSPDRSGSILEAPLEDKKDAYIDPTDNVENVQDMKWDQIRDQANRGEAFEHNLTLWQALKYYRKVSV